MLLLQKAYLVQFLDATKLQYLLKQDPCFKNNLSQFILGKVKFKNRCCVCVCVHACICSLPFYAKNALMEKETVQIPKPHPRR